MENCNINLDYNMCVIPITSLYILLYMLTMMKLDIPNSKDGICELRPT